MHIKSQKISQNLAINKIELPESSGSTIDYGKNIIFAIDVSGSMSRDLPTMRQQLKNRIPDLIRENDTISLIWFSGQNQAGVLKEGVQVKNLQDLQKLNDAIDRFLQPIGLTAFLPPLELTEKVINNLSSNGKMFSFIFLSDGYNNDSYWPDVIKKISDLEPKIGTATFIEYGYHADSKALSEMAELIGGEKIFSKDFCDYDDIFENVVSRYAEKKIAVDISSLKGKIKYQFLFTFNKYEQSIVTFSTINDKETLLLPSNVNELYFFSRNKVGEEVVLADDCKLAASYLLADKLRYNDVEDLLINVGDSDLIKSFNGAFGKQKLNDLRSKIKDCLFNPQHLFKRGKFANYKVDKNAFCLIDLLELLQSGDNKFYPYHPYFDYKRITAKQTTKVELTEDVKEKLKTAKTLSEISKLTSVLESPEFVYPDNKSNIGFDFNTLVWNQDRANISVMVRVDGKVKLPTNDFGLNVVDSFIYRNFTLVADGVTNVNHIPVKLDDQTRAVLFQKELLSTVHHEDGTFVDILDISSLPIINRSMTMSISGKKLANLEYQTLQVKAAHKYLKELKKEHSPKGNVLSAEKYSVEASEWLESIGVTDYNGFCPKKETVETNDFYMAQVLETKIEKLSSIPKTIDVFNKVSNIEKAESDTSIKVKPLTVSEELYKSEIDTIGGMVFNTFDYSKQDGVDVDKLNQLEKQFNNLRRKLLVEISKIKFGVILSRTWFKEFESMEQNELEGVKFDGISVPLKVKFDFKEEKVNI